MSGVSPLPPDRVPTLTEVVAWPEGAAAMAPAAGEVPQASAGPTPVALTETQLTHQILADVQRQIDLMLEYRLREALAPVLARAADTLVRDARSELASNLRDVVARAVAQELSRHRAR